MISCSATDKIRKAFLDVFFEYMSTTNKEKRLLILDGRIPGNLSQLEKAMLYYLASAKYYRRSSNLKEAHAIYKKILQLLIQYVNGHPKQKSDMREHLDNVSTQIVWRIIQCIYSAYEHIHVVEIQKLKWNSSKEMYQLLSLNQLSLFPEIEETLYAYYELELSCHSINGSAQNPGEKISISDLYHLQAISPYRINSSIYNRLLSLRFKSLLNRRILKSILAGYGFSSVYDPLHPILFYSGLKQTISSLDSSSELTPLKQLLLSLTGTLRQNGSAEQQYSGIFLQATEQLIIDSIFCLQKFIETVYPHNRTTLFTSSFTAHVYTQLFEWTQLFVFLFLLYAYMDDDYDKKNSKKKQEIRNRLASHCLKRYEASCSLTADQQKATEYLLHQVFSFGNQKIEMPQPDLTKGIAPLIGAEKLRFSEMKSQFQKRAGKFYDRLYNEVGKINVQMTDCNYLAEMAIKKYQQAFSVHKEGKPYKNIIDDMYYLNDDLDNDPFRFFLALERYQINTDEIKTKMNNLKNIYSNSSLYEIANYIKHPSWKT
jgi:hypothetical protein